MRRKEGTLILSSIVLSVLLGCSVLREPEESSGHVAPSDDSDATPGLELTEATWRTQFDDVKPFGSARPLPHTALIVSATVVNKTNRPIRNIHIRINVEGQSPPFPHTLVYDMNLRGFIPIPGCSDLRGWTDGERRAYALQPGEARGLEFATMAGPPNYIPRGFLDVTGVAATIIEVSR